MDYEILGKNVSCITRTGILEFVASEFNLNLPFVQLFIG